MSEQDENPARSITIQKNIRTLLPEKDKKLFMVNYVRIKKHLFVGFQGIKENFSELIKNGDGLIGNQSDMWKGL